MVVVDLDEFRILPALIALYRAVHAQIRGDVTGNRPTTLATCSTSSRRTTISSAGRAVALLGLTSWATGDLEAAYRLYDDGMARVRRTGSLPDVIGGAIALAEIRIAQGRLRDAQETYLARVAARDEGWRADPPGGRRHHVGLADIAPRTG